MQVIAWMTVSEMTYNVSSGTLNPAHSLSVGGVCVRYYIDVIVVYSACTGVVLDIDNIYRYR